MAENEAKLRVGKMAINSYDIEESSESKAKWNKKEDAQMSEGKSNVQKQRASETFFWLQWNGHRSCWIQWLVEPSERIWFK